MSGQIQNWKDEYYAEVEKLSLCVTVTKDLVGKNADATAKLAEAHEQVGRLKDVKKNFNLELRLVKDRTIKKEFDAEAQLLDGRVTGLVKELRSIQASQQHSDLVAGNKAALTDTKGKGNDELLAGANQIQDLTMSSLSRTTAMIAESQELGESTIENLRDQRRQIGDIDRDISEIDSNLERADKLIRSFARRMATDRIIQAFAAINITILGGLILYVLITGRSLGTIETKDGEGTTGPSTATAAPASMP